MLKRGWSGDGDSSPVMHRRIGCFRQLLCRQEFQSYLVASPVIAVSFCLMYDWSMFEQLVIRRGEGTGSNLDLGLIAESALFYQNVHILFDYGSLSEVLRTILPDELISLLQSKYIKATLLRETLGTYTARPFGLPIHKFIGFEFAGTKDKRINPSKEEIVKEIFCRASGSSYATKRAARRFSQMVPQKRLTRGFGHGQGIPGLALQDIQDREFVRSAVESALLNLSPGIKFPDSWRFNLIECDEGFIVDTNLDFIKIQELHRKYLKDPSATLTPASLTSAILDARGDLSLSAHYSSDFVTSSTSSKIMQIRFKDILTKRVASAKEIEMFQELNFDSAHAVREAVNKKERSVRDILHLLDRAERFKDWLRDTHPDERLLHQYQSAIASDTWIQKLPTKALRFVFFTGPGVVADLLGLGGVGTAVGVGLAATDSLVVEKVIGGWKPNHFVDGAAKKFIDR